MACSRCWCDRARRGWSARTANRATRGFRRRRESRRLIKRALAPASRGPATELEPREAPARVAGADVRGSSASPHTIPALKPWRAGTSPHASAEIVQQHARAASSRHRANIDVGRHRR
jgi:hypothetical protein